MLSAFQESLSYVALFKATENVRQRKTLYVLPSPPFTDEVHESELLTWVWACSPGCGGAGESSRAPCSAVT